METFDQFEKILTKDFQPGDAVVHTSWFGKDGVRSSIPAYEVVSITEDKIAVRTSSDGYLNRFSKEAFSSSESSDGKQYWVRKIEEMPYDPNGEGETDQDI